ASAERAYELAKTAFGPADPTTIKLQQNYGTFLVLVGSRTDAFTMLNEALQAIEQTYGTDAYESVSVLVTLGEILRNDAQLSAVQRALALQKKHYPNDVLAYADVAKRTGRYLATSRDQNQQAIPILQEALDIYTAEYGRNGEELIPVLMSLGDAHARFGRSQKQKSAYRRALSLAKKSGDPLRHADLLHTAGVHLMQLSASPDARKYLVKAHDIFAQHLGLDHFKTGNALLSLGRFHVASQRHSRAEPKLLAALEVFKKDSDFRNYELLALSLLVQVYEELGDRDAATPYCQAIGQVTPWSEDQEYRPIYKRAPAYPENAVKSGIAGHVILEYSVDENGLVQSPVVVDLNGPDSFIPAAMTSVATFRYAPRYIDGKPVQTPGVRNKFTFKIE
ncbi:MAG: tetratricopeptide repeat protein, partial [Gammaproteobacteria bacterium]|nr:tetratricopeptide repeat protein [Gammaproteobacteria bacterium]